MPATLAACSRCAGNGSLIDPNGAMLCPDCNGAGFWVMLDDGRQLAYPLPLAVTPVAPGSHERLQLVRHLATGSALAVAAGSLAYIFFQGPASPVNLVWGPGIAHALLGAGGLAGSYGLSLWKVDESSLLSLHDLPAFTVPVIAIDARPYANRRIGELLETAAILAQEMHCEQIDDALLLVALLDTSRIRTMLGRLEKGANPLRQAALGFIVSGANGHVISPGLSGDARMRLAGGLQQAVERSLPYFDTEDILLSYAKEPGRFKELFVQTGLTYEETFAISRWYAQDEEQTRRWSFWLERGRARPKGFMNKAWTALPTPFLERYSQDLTKLAATGRVPTVTVREPEINRLLEVLGRTQKNSGLLVGEPGVGKESVLGAIALRMIEENVPEVLKDKRLVMLDTATLLGGGESATQDVQRILEEVAQAGNVILIIPDVHILAGGQGTGPLDAATLLAGALNRGSVQVISTATYAEYHRWVEGNAALTNLLDIVEINEMTAAQAIDVLEEETPQIESRQQVLLTYPAIAAAVSLAQRYVPDKVLPDSALTLLDEAASSVRLRKESWVRKSDIEATVEKRTGVPVGAASQRESEVLLNLEAELHKRVVGQEQAIQAVSAALRRSRAGLHDSKRPIASFLFVGPTGTGKTETAKAVADLYFGGDAHMVRLDMSEYQDARSVYRLIGAPAADSDSHTEGGALTQPIREHPFCLLLLDELEKAYPDVLNLFLQLLDDGRLTENTGRTVSFTNTMIVATSNAGSSELMEILRQGATPEKSSQETLRILQDHFRPEFLNRFDAIVPFLPLRLEEVGQIVTMMLAAVAANAKEKGYALEFAPETVTYLATTGYDPLYGARPLRRLIQDKVEGALANLILQGQLKPGGSLLVTPQMIQS